MEQVNSDITLGIDISGSQAMRQTVRILSSSPNSSINIRVPRKTFLKSSGWFLPYIKHFVSSSTTFNLLKFHIKYIVNIPEVILAVQFTLFSLKTSNTHHTKTSIEMLRRRGIIGTLALDTLRTEYPASSVALCSVIQYNRCSMFLGPSELALEAKRHSQLINVRKFRFINKINNFTFRNDSIVETNRARNTSVSSIRRSSAYVS